MSHKAELVLNVLSYDGRPLTRPLSAHVAGDTCVIGRHVSCQLELPDPEREISGHHVLIYRRGNRFSVTDVSTNGTYLNDAEEPLDPSQSVDLRVGDRLGIGRYVVEVDWVESLDVATQGLPAVGLSGMPRGASGSSACPDILELISAEPDAPLAAPAETRGTSGAESGEARIGRAVAQTFEGRREAAPGAAAGVRPSPGGARPLSGHAAPPQAVTQAFFVDPADAPTMLAGFDEAALHAAFGLASDQRQPPGGHAAFTSRLPRTSRETAGLEGDAAQGATAPDAGLGGLSGTEPVIQCAPELIPEGSRPLLAHVQQRPALPAAERDIPPIEERAQPASPSDRRQAPTTDRAEMPTVLLPIGYDLLADPAEAEVGESAAAPDQLAQAGLGAQSAPSPGLSVVAPNPSPETPVATDRPPLALEPASEASVSPEAPTQLLSVPDPTRVADAAEAGSCQASPAVDDGQSRVLSPGLEHASVRAGVLSRSRQAPTQAQSPMADSLDPDTARDDPVPLSGDSVGQDGVSACEPPAAAASVPPERVEEPGPTLSREVAVSDSREPVQADAPGGGAATQNRAQVIDDATRIRACAEELPQKPLTPAAKAQVQAFLTGLGVGQSDEIGDSKMVMRASGELLRVMTQGLVDAMMAQDTFKNGLRLGPPSPRGQAGNPFRFSVDLEDTLERALWRPSRGHLDAATAAQQAFDDVRVHQMALMAGFRGVLKALLARLEPHAIEQEVEGQAGWGQLLPSARKAKCWDLFVSAFEEIADDVSEDFTHVFGEAFSHAYDDHVERAPEEKRRR